MGKNKTLGYYYLFLKNQDKIKNKDLLIFVSGKTQVRPTIGRHSTSILPCMEKMWNLGISFPENLTFGEKSLQF